MRRGLNQRQKKYVIIGLCMILLLMAVGYSAFSQMLNINGTANITNNWCVGFDNTKTNAFAVTKGVAAGTSPTGSMVYDNNACATNYVHSVTLNSSFYQPGDKIEYTLTIANKSSVGAAIKSILVDGVSTNSNKKITKGNIKYTVKMPESVYLVANTGTTTMKVIAEFQNDTDIESGYTGESQTITVAINTEQDDGNGGMVIENSQYVYAINSSGIVKGDSTVAGTENMWCQVRESYQAWCYVSEEYGENSCTDNREGFSSQNECLNYIDGWGEEYTCEQGTIPEENSCVDDAWGYDEQADCLNSIDGWGEEYTCEQGTITVEPADFGTTYNSCAATGENVCIRYTIEDSIVTGADVCFIKNGTEYCLQGWVDECQDSHFGEAGIANCTFTGTPTVYNSNRSILQSAFTENNECTIQSDFIDGISCSSDIYASAYTNGVVRSGHGNETIGGFDCYIYSTTLNNFNGARCGYYYPEEDECQDCMDGCGDDEMCQNNCMANFC